MWKNIFLYNISEGVEDQEESRESSESISSKIDEDNLERKLRLKSGSWNVLRCFGDILKILIKWYMWFRNKDHKDWMWKNKIHF